MILTVNGLARMMDVSCVRTDVTIDEIHQLTDLVKRYHCACAFALPCYVPELKTRLADAPAVGVGTVVGFPAGANSTPIKAAEAEALCAQGADELDMVMNVGMLLSGREDYVENDMRAVVEAAAGTPVKVILETHYLSDHRIVAACRLAMRAGVAFVKTATGWPPTGATLHNVALMKKTVGDTLKVKAAGGVRDLETVRGMIRIGVSRFGVGMQSAEKLLTELSALPGGQMEVASDD